MVELLPLRSFDLGKKKDRLRVEDNRLCVKEDSWLFLELAARSHHY
jgi:hypothetical protein